VRAAERAEGAREIADDEGSVPEAELTLDRADERLARRADEEDGDEPRPIAPRPQRVPRDGVDRQRLTPAEALREREPHVPRRAERERHRKRPHGPRLPAQFFEHRCRACIAEGRGDLHHYSALSTQHSALSARPRAWRKWGMVRRRPSSSGTAGSHPTSDFA